jgi:acetoin utilization deacetylase AcuC-like enzyme
MGFCLFNNIAVAAMHALEVRGVRRVLIVDWDVHHGNGTQDTFYDDPRVLFVSMHMSPHYPGTGGVDEVGAGRAAGCTVNVPLRGGCGDGAISQVFARLVEPLTNAFRPELILASSGYDSQAGDPLGGLGYSRSAFQWMAAELGRLAESVGAAGPVCFLEGGYDPQMLAWSVVATIKGLADERVEFAPAVTPLEHAAVAAALRAQASHWGADLRSL